MKIGAGNRFFSIFFLDSLGNAVFWSGDTLKMHFLPGKSPKMNSNPIFWTLGLPEI
jgi:hypothetical protein